MPRGEEKVCESLVDWYQLSLYGQFKYLQVGQRLPAFPGPGLRTISPFVSYLRLFFVSREIQRIKKWNTISIILWKKNLLLSTFTALDSLLFLNYRAPIKCNSHCRNVKTPIGISQPYALQPCSHSIAQNTILCMRHSHPANRNYYLSVVILQQSVSRGWQRKASFRFMDSSPFNRRMRERIEVDVHALALNSS